MNHTGQELELMLAGRKPLAMFYDDADVASEDSPIPEDDFDLLVEQKGFRKGVRVFNGAFDPRKGGPFRTRYVLYALPGEEWRIPAMFLALEARANTSGYDEGIDRIVGALLGYSNEEIEAHLQRRTS